VREETVRSAQVGGLATSSRRSLIIHAIYAVCLASATVTHVLFDVRYGILLSSLEPLGYPLFVRLYWASLTFLDPLAALLLFFRPRAGLILCVGIIVTGQERGQRKEGNQEPREFEFFGFVRPATASRGETVSWLL
jgi:hypothetical protein